MKLSVITFIVIFLISITNISSDAVAADGKWAEAQKFDVMLDAFSSPESIIYKGKMYKVAHNYEDEDLAKMAPSAGLLEDADYGNVTPMSLTVYEDIAFD